MEAIAARRSIRRFKDTSIPVSLIEQVLEATIQAPSAKNAQPWRFVVLQGHDTQELGAMMRHRADTLTKQGADIGSLLWSARVIEQAPVTVMVFNQSPPPEIPQEFHDDYRWVMLQSTGGAIQTMLLAAQALGLGSLWICDVLFAYDEIHAWLARTDDELVAAVALGYANEAPGPRPRRPVSEVVEWRGSS